MEESQISTKFKVNKQSSSFSNISKKNFKMSLSNQYNSENIKIILNIPRITEGTKICSVCELEQNVNEFDSFGFSKDGLTSDCKKCNNKKRKKWLKSH